MFKITIIGIDARLLSDVARFGKITYIDQDRNSINATIDDCKFKVKAERVVIRNPEKHTYLSLARTDFEEISIT